MLLRELLSSCQNQWKGLNRNNDFKVILSFEDRTYEQGKYQYVMNSFYCDDDRYLLEYRTRKVLFWELRYKDNLYVEIEGKY